MSVAEIVVTCGLLGLPVMWFVGIGIGRLGAQLADRRSFHDHAWQIERTSSGWVTLTEGHALPLGLSVEYDALPRVGASIRARCQICWRDHEDAMRQLSDGCRVLAVMCPTCREQGRDRWIAEHGAARRSASPGDPAGARLPVAWVFERTSR